MSTLLLKTKFYIPPVRPEFVPRPRLLERLDEGVYHKLILLSAPAGFGKTTLLSDWAHRQNESNLSPPVAWLSLDQDDNDPARFLAYLVAALQRVEESIGQDVGAALQSPRPPKLERLLTPVLNQVNTIPERLVLILDDYHLITAEPIHKAVSFLLDGMPQNMQLVIATRADPPLPLARLRGRGQLTELRQPDLRFTPREASEFLNQAMGLELAEGDVVALDQRTEGWVAGLQMAALSIRGRKQRQNTIGLPQFIQTFTGSHHFILDYLMQEVLDQQPPAIQEFLLQTSILKRLTAPLCDHLIQAPELGARAPTTGIQPSLATHQSPSQQILEQLETANLFIVPLDDERRWYRYHHLFADLLRQRLQQAQPESVAHLHWRASIWYEQNGQMAEAIDHALSAQDTNRAAQLVEQAAEATMMRSEVSTLRNWVEALPDGMVRTRPFLCIYHAWALLLSGHPLETANDWVQKAVEADTDGSARGEVLVFRALLAAYQGDTRQNAELGSQALEVLPEDRLFVRSLLAGTMGLCQLYSGDLEVARQALNEAVRVSQKAGNLMNTVLALHHLGELALIEGQIFEAKTFFEQALEAATDDQGRRRPIAGVALIGLGQILREWNNLEAAASSLTEGIDLITSWGEAGAINGYTGLARVMQAQGDIKGARQAIHTAQQLAIKFEAMDLDDISVAMNQARLWVHQGNLAAASRWLAERGLNGEAGARELTEKDGRDPVPLYRAIEYLVAAQVHLAVGRPDWALGTLAPLLVMAEKAGWMGVGLYILVLQALALQAQGHDAEALAPLERALSLAESQAMVRTFLDEGPPMAQLLRRAASLGIAPRYASKLLAAFDSPGPPDIEAPALHPHGPAPAGQPLLDPLSERELEVLRLLVVGLSNPEIAEQLYIAVSTVRSHLKSIYSKLDVHKRWDAVQRAQDLGLI